MKILKYFNNIYIGYLHHADVSIIDDIKVDMKEVSKFIKDHGIVYVR